MLPTIYLIKILIFCVITLEIHVNAVPKVTVQELTSGWTLRNENRTISIRGLKLPSGVYTALSAKYGDILKSKNDDNLRWIAYDNWTYVADFEIHKDDLGFTRRINLTLHGIDTVSIVRLNGKEIGRTDNMFVRYSFDIYDAVKEDNTLEIEIKSPIWASKFRADEFAGKNLKYPPNCPAESVNGFCHRNMLRKMQSSFGTDANLAAMSMGIWKYITLEFYDTAIMRDVDIAATKNITHWKLDIKIFLDSHSKVNFYGNLTFIAPDLFDEPIQFPRRLIKYSSLMDTFKVDIPRNKVVEWWPNGYGEQKLYPLIFTMKCYEVGSEKFRSGWVTRKFLRYGFRTIELVEDKDEWGRTFYFKVNDQPIFIKGAIYLPSHILPEEESHLSSSAESRIKHLLESAREANLNMLRIWGGGVYGSDLFYDIADTYGFLIWQDMPFTTATYPVNDEFVESVRNEAAQNAKRLAYHPSFAMIVTNDEVELYLVKNRSDFSQDAERLEGEYQQFFMGTIKHELEVISRNIYSPRPGPLLSTPSLGYKESKKDLAANPQDPNFGDVHFWPDDKEDAWDANIYPAARFISEYGFQSLPIHVSWGRTLGPDDTIQGLIKHRQHHANGFQALKQVIDLHMPHYDWENDVASFIYFSQVVQAMAVKTATEVFLSNRVDYRTMGAIFWHLNDVWVAPTWSSIDYYGNYKLLYYWSREFLAPISIIALKDEENNAMKVTMIRDGVLKRRETTEVNLDPDEPETFNVTINTYLWSELYPQKTIIREEHVGSRHIKQFSLSLNKILVEPFTENNCFVEVVLSEGETIYASNVIFLGLIRDAVGFKDPSITIEINKVAPESNAANNIYRISYPLTVYVSSPALFVFIEIFHPEIKKYELSHNGFLQAEPLRVVHLTIEHEYKKLDEELTNKHIKVTTINQYMLKTDELPNL